MGAGSDTLILCQMLPQHTENNYKLKKTLCEHLLIPWGCSVERSSDFWLGDHPNLKTLHASNQKEAFNVLMEVTVNCVSLAMRVYDYSKIFPQISAV